MSVSFANAQVALEFFAKNSTGPAFKQLQDELAKLEKSTQQQDKWKQWSQEMTKQAQSWAAVEKQKAAAIRETEQELEKQKKAAEEANNANKLSWTDLKSAIDIAAMAIEKFKQVYDFAQMGAVNERLRTSGQQLAAGFSTDMDTIIAKVKEASLGSVSEMDIVAAANRAMMLNVTGNADQMANLMQVAAFRARAMGITTTQAFNDMVTGIGRNSPLILDNLGIITKGWAEEAKAAGVAYDQQFILNKVLEQGNSMMSQAGGLVRDNASEYEYFSAEVENLKDKAKELVASGLTPVLRATREHGEMIAKVTQAYEDGNITLEEKNKIMMGMSRGYVDLATVEKQLYDATMNVTEADRLVNAAMSDINNSFGAGQQAMEAYIQGEKQLVLATQEATIATQEYIPEFDKLLKMSESISNETQNYADKQEEVKNKQAEIKAQIDELIAQGWSPLGEKIQGLQSDYDALGVKYDENAEKHRQAMGKIQYDLLVTKLSVDGLTEQEAAMAQQAGLLFGVLDQKSIDTAKNFDVVAEAVANGELRVQDMQRALDLLPTLKSIDVVINAIANMAGGGVHEQTGTGPLQGGRAGGGTVEAGKMYEVNEGGVPELLNFNNRQFLMMPNQGGAVVPLSSGGGGGGGGGGLTVSVVYASPITVFDRESAAQQLIPIIEQAYYELQNRGVIK